MPAKSRRGRGKYSPQSKKGRGKLNRPAMPARQPAVTQNHEPAPLARVPTPLVKPLANRYPYIATELRTIGILAGVMLIVLVALALVLS